MRRVLVVDAHDADAIGALVLDQQRECVEESEEELCVAYAGFYVSHLHVQLHEVVVVIDAKLPEEGGVFDLLDLSVEGLPLVEAFGLHDLVLAGGGDDLPVGVAAVEGVEGVVLRSELLGLLAPRRVAVRDEPCAPLLARLLRGPALGLHVEWLFWRFGRSEHLEEIRPADSFLLTVGECFFEEVIGPRAEATSLEDMRDRYSLDSSQQLVLISGLPGRIPEDHLIKNNSQRPHVALGCVWTAFQDLRSHVNGTADA